MENNRGVPEQIDSNEITTTNNNKVQPLTREDFKTEEKYEAYQEQLKTITENRDTQKAEVTGEAVVNLEKLQKDVNLEKGTGKIQENKDIVFEQRRVEIKQERSDLEDRISEDTEGEGSGGTDTGGEQGAGTGGPK